ncbi:hypothetical protein HK097_007392 [Rhizophlyctis rosea]|uniref:WW domain-containing protein n=1 Tax=Rhizophlyctis rosea TaxID=64517 RepID=A0AAD5SLR2_9FUNG|nr:hypothetical protein HK097_007392 [Rhizophlyctis rosea]
MADTVAPPPGPPPPKVPEGWKAVWNEQYKEWFYVNIYTKVSQWDKPITAVYPPAESASQPPAGPPPKYDEKTSQPVNPEKGGLATGTPNTLAEDEAYARKLAQQGTSTSSNNLSEDEAYARRLQEEENARTAGGQNIYSGGPASYGPQYGQPPYPGQQPYQQQPNQQQPFQNQMYEQQPQYAPTKDKGKKGGFLSKLLGGKSSSSSHGYPQQAYGNPYQQQHHGNPYQQGYGKRPGGGGMGTAGAAALGVGGGLLAGAIVADAINDNEHDAYMDGYTDGQDNDFGGGDFGGGDFGGGDF